MAARRGAVVLVGLALTTCAYRPIRFADQPPAARVADDLPIALPRKRAFLAELYAADVFVRREVVKALDPRRYPAAGDVNALDEVPESTWYRTTLNAFNPLQGYERDGPPVPPWTRRAEPAASETPGAEVVTDARGLAYELVADDAGRERMRTAAAVMASRLVHALGYRTPEVHLVRSPAGKRLAATRWPPGVDLGPTTIQSRSDDPNDAIAHVDRRTLRALALVAAWLDLKQLPPRMLRDLYVGKPGRGHVEHVVVGLDGALGVARYHDALGWAQDADRQDSNFFLKLFSMGLSPKPPGLPPVTPWPSVGLIAPTLAVDQYDVAPPFEPFDRLQPADAYWAAKRIAALPHFTLALAIMAGQLDPPAQNWLLQVLHLRRGQVIAWGYDRTTPLEVVTLRAGSAGADALLLADLAIVSRVMAASRSRYLVRYLDSEAHPLAPETTVRPDGAHVVVPLPAALGERDYVVVQVQGYRDDQPLPRPFEAHLRPRTGRFRLAGVRH
jgi:hypothetical protein